MCPAHALATHQRQIDLDRFPSSHPPGAGADFDARAFAATLKTAYGNSVTIFAKGRHGCAHYPSKVCDARPELAPGRYLLGEQTVARETWRLAMRRLNGIAPFGHGLASTIQVYPRRRAADLLLTLLHYISVRKALDIDMIEERCFFVGEVLRLPAAARKVPNFFPV